MAMSRHGRALITDEQSTPAHASVLSDAPPLAPKATSRLLRELAIWLLLLVGVPYLLYMFELPQLVLAPEN
jgi:hypothetical protein